MEPMLWKVSTAAAGADGARAAADSEAASDEGEEEAAAAAVKAIAKLERSVDLLTLLRVRDQIKQQLADYSTADHAREVICNDYIKNESKIKKDMKGWERHMEEVTVSLQNKTLALQRMQLTFALRNKVKQNDDDSRLITETMTHIVMLSKRIITYQQQAREKEQKLIDIRRKRLTLKTAGRQKLLQIHTLMKKQKEEPASVNISKTLDVLHKNLEKERQIITVIQNVFQGIIIASRVNWAEDPSLKAIVLQLEKGICLP